MCNFNKYILLTASIFVVSNAAAVSSTIISSNKVLGTHTTHLPLELKPALFSSSQTYKVAAVCALGDTECGQNSGFGKSDNDTNNGVKKCSSGGYVLSSSCNSPKVSGAKCPYHASYSKPCICPNTYKYTCSGAGYTSGTGTGCDGKYTACSCSSGYNWNGSACVANSCSGYTASTCSSPKVTSTPSCLSATTQYYTSCTCPTTYKYSCSGSGYAGGTGTGCDGKYTACSCSNGYNWNGSACVANSCSGYSECSCGGEISANICYSGETKKFSSCKACCDSKYQYTTENCTNGKVLSGDSCGGKYALCENPLKIGDILFSDRTTGAELVAEKKPIGIVFDTENKLALGLVSNEAPWLESRDASGAPIIDYDVPTLTNFGQAAEALTDMDGQQNTDKILTFSSQQQKSCSSDYSSPNYCQFVSQVSYRNSDCAITGTLCSDWFSPSLGQLNQIYQNKDVIKKIGDKLGASFGFAWGESGHGYYRGKVWSSTENSLRKGWMINFVTGEIQPYDKVYDIASLRVIKYDTSKKVGKLPFLFSDMTTGKELVNGKTPIGIVFDEERKLALALKIDEQLEAWSTENFDIPELTNYAMAPIGEKLIDAMDSNNWKAKEDTLKIVNYCRNNKKSCPAAEYAYNYSTAGTNTGDWSLPTTPMFKKLYSMADDLDFNLQMLNISGLYSRTEWSLGVWSCNEGSKNIGLANIMMGGGDYSLTEKTAARKIMLVIEYGKVGK